MRQSNRRSLSPTQEVLIRTLMTDRMPDQLKLGFALWARDVVRELIRQRSGFLMPVRTDGENNRGQATVLMLMSNSWSKDASSSPSTQTAL